MIENLGEYGWWGNEGIFGGGGSLVKYGGNTGMEGVEKCVGVWGEVREDVGRCVVGVGSVLGCEGWGVGL